MAGANQRRGGRPTSALTLEKGSPSKTPLASPSSMRRAEPRSSGGCVPPRARGRRRARTTSSTLAARPAATCAWARRTTSS